MTHPQAAPSLETVRAELREQMPIAREWAYFDHATVGPLSHPAAEAVRRYVDQSVTGGDTHWLKWNQAATEARRRAAGLIGAQPGEVTLVGNTTAGINLVAEGIDWQSGDNVVTLDGEYPANVYPWVHQQDRGVETRRVPTNRGRVDLDQLRDACDSRTRVVTVSWVGFAAGYRTDLDAVAEIAHACEAFFFVDAIQGLGVFPLDVTQTPIDGLAACGHKWMLGPEGAGFAYLRQEWLDRLRPIGVGVKSVVNAFDYDNIDYRLRKTADRYEGGSTNMPGAIALAANLALLTRWPQAKLAEAVLDITDLACERLRSIGAVVASHREWEPTGHDPRSGIVAFELPGTDPEQIARRLLEAGVVCRSRGGRVRISPHAYNTPEDVERMMELLRRL